MNVDLRLEKKNVSLVSNCQKQTVVPELRGHKVHTSTIQCNPRVMDNKTQKVIFQ